jgi:thioesterase domain-containing protein
MAYILDASKNIHVSPEAIAKIDEQHRWDWFAEKIQGDNPHTDKRQSRRVVELHRANHQAMFAYQARPWQGKAVFFRAEQHHVHNAKTPEQAWIPLISDLKIASIPGNHYTMNEFPHVVKLAEILQHTIERV